MRSFLVNFAGVAAIAFLQIHCKAEGVALKDKIVRLALNHNEPAVVKVGINGVTSLEFPSKIEAIDGYGFSQSPDSGDAFQISYTKGTNYFSVRALKPGVTGNLTGVLDQKVYSLFFEGCWPRRRIMQCSPAALRRCLVGCRWLSREKRSISVTVWSRRYAAF